MSWTTPKFDVSPRTLWANTTPLNTCKALSLVLGLHILQVGVWVFYDPINCAKAFGLRYDGKPWHGTFTSTSKNSSSTKTETGRESDEGNYWPRLFACREVGFGGLVLIFAAMGEWRGAALGHGVPAVVLGVVAGGILML